MSINLLPEEMRGKKEKPIEEKKSPQETSFEIKITRPSSISKKEEKLSPPAVSSKEQISETSPKSQKQSKPQKINFDFLSKLKDIFRSKAPSKIAEESKDQKKEFYSVQTPKKETKEELREKSSQELAESRGVEVSLMPEEILVTERMVRERIFILITVILVAGFILILSYLWLQWRSEIAREKVYRVKSEITTLEEQIKQYSQIVSQAKNLEAKASKVGNLFQNHVYWTKFLALLEKYTVPDVYYGDFSAEVDNKIILNAVGRDLTAVARQLVAFSNAPEFVKEVNISNISGGKGGVTFQINLTLVDRLFNK